MQHTANLPIMIERSKYMSLFEKWKDKKIIKVVTGSNVYLLSGEIATLLTERYVEIQLYLKVIDFSNVHFLLLTQQFKIYNVFENPSGQKCGNIV